MYYKIKVDIPAVKGKISRFSKDGQTYIRYMAERTYRPEKKFNSANYRTIGKVCENDSSKMYPNETYTQYFDADFLKEEVPFSSARSCCLKTGSFLVMKKLIEELKLEEYLLQAFSAKDAALVLDLALYCIITENNAGQYFPDYEYDHPLFAENMHICSDSKISDFFLDMSENERRMFLGVWNQSKDHEQKIYISYDSTNKNCQAGDMDLAEFGHPKDDRGLPVINMSMAYDTENWDPLFYEEYPGSINDVSQLKYMLEKAAGYGYQNVGFILDRGYFSESNIRYMDEKGISYIMMFKGKKELVRSLILSEKGTFEDKWDHYIERFDAYGADIDSYLLSSDIDKGKKRHFHLYYSDDKAAAEKKELKERISRMEEALKKVQGKSFEASREYLDLFDLFYWEDKENKKKILQSARVKTKVVQEELSLCGYYVIITSEEMTAEHALTKYKNRDVSEKLFRDDKTFIGGRSLRVQSTNSAASKLFIEFIALIIRNRIYTKLSDETQRLKKWLNYMNVAAALKELEKIMIVRDMKGQWRLSYAVTKTQKTILKAFGMDEHKINTEARELGRYIEKCDKENVEKHKKTATPEGASDDGSDGLGDLD